MKSSLFLKLARGGVSVAVMVLVVPVFGQAVTVEAGKRPASISAPPVTASVAEVSFEPNPACTPSALTARYPLQSINSMERANQALVDVKKAKKQTETIFKHDEKACLKTFFANKCIADAKNRRRTALNEIRPVQIEAERFKRHDAVNKREQALEKKQAKDAGLQGGQTPEEKRAANEAAFEKKVRDHEAAQEKVIEKRARTERRRQKKAAEAAKRAKQSKKPSASAPAPGSAPISAPAPEKVPVPVSAPVPVTTPAHQNSR